jgi:L-alanine-DL-glutamate epimerase-like enolase superfamily enzyme
MSSASHALDTAVASLDVTAYKVPTATDEEADGTLRWDSTSVVVVEVAADGVTGLGYTYCHPAAAEVIEGKLASIVEGADALMPEQTWAEMQVRARQMGHAGITTMAISAVDVALWDLKARLLGVCLADALPGFIAAHGSTARAGSATTPRISSPTRYATGRSTASGA